MKITQARLESLPTVRLRYGDGDHFYKVPYINAVEPIDLDLAVEYFKPNGRGIPWNCGVSTAALEQAEKFKHPVLYVHTIGTATYVVVMTYPGGYPKLAIRYNHRAGALIEAYDSSRKKGGALDKEKFAEFKDLLSRTPVLHLLKGRSEAGKGGTGHSPSKGYSGGHTKHHAVGLKGNARRMAHANLLEPTLAERLDREAS